MLDVVVFTFVAAGGSTLVATAAALVGAPAVASVLEALRVAAAFVVLQPLMELRFGASVGKLLLHLEVVREQGGRPDLPTLVRRLFARFPFGPLLVVPDPLLPGWATALVNWGTLAVVIAGFVVTFFRGGRTLSDVLTRTRVVYRMHG